MSSESENPSGPGAASHSGLRRRSTRGRTFRPRHRLSKPKVEGTPDTPPPYPPASAHAEPAPIPPPLSDPPTPSGPTLAPASAFRARPAPRPLPEPERTFAPEAAHPAHDPQDDDPETLASESESADPDFRDEDAEGEAPTRTPEISAPLPGTVEALAYRPASPRSIEQAVLEVKRVVDALQQALRDMEEVLELIEDAEQQKVADEREVIRLQEMVRQLTQARDRILPPPPERPRRELPEGASPSASGGPGPAYGSSGSPGPSRPPRLPRQGPPDDRLGRRRRRGRGRGRGPEGGGMHGAPATSAPPPSRESGPSYESSGPHPSSASDSAPGDSFDHDPAPPQARPESMPDVPPHTD